MALIDALIKYLRPTKAKRYPIGISQSVLSTLREAARSTHPDEFLCFLTGEPASNFQSVDMDDGYVITDFYIIPGTKANPVSAEVKSVNIPITDEIIGTLHTHPSGSAQPSNEDRNLFRQYPVNIIWGHPYQLEEWKAYSSDGEPLPKFPMLKV